VFEPPPARATSTMADRISTMLAAYALATDAERVPAVTAHEVERRVLDSIGVAVAGFDEAAPTAARRYAAGEARSGGALIWGTADRAAPETAGFANAVAVRCLDDNDTYLSREPLHPSDAIAPLLALAEIEGRSGEEIVAAIAVAYEVGVGLCDAASLRAHGWDHVNHLGVGIACGAARLLGLDEHATRHAIALTAVPHAAMRQTRVGELSMWKGAAAAEAGRNAVFAARLARAGMTGPFEPFEGEMGYVRQLLGGELDIAALESISEGRTPEAILRTSVKRWPVEYHAQSAVDAALRLRAELGDDPGSAIASVRIDTFDAAYEIIAKDPEKWDPRTRETADHSLQYIVVAALLDGEVTTRTFDESRFRDPTVLRLLREATEVRPDPELSAGYPEGIPNRIAVRTTDGRELVREVRFPPGHARNPMTDDELSAKFRGNVEGRWKPERADRVEELIGSLHSAPTVDGLITSLEPWA
jgi:2-methylcitrate dehydratase